TFADRDDLEAVTRAVNGALTHLEERRAWLAQARHALATAQAANRSDAQRLGRHEPLVLHDLTDADHRALLRAWLDGQRTVVLAGAWIATRTSRDGDQPTVKLDVRRETP